MMEVFDDAKFQNYLDSRNNWKLYQLIYHQYLLPCLLFGCIGGFTWAIRSTSGWSGIDGALIPGLTWSLLIYYFLQQRGIDARFESSWFGLGISIGGILVYDQYISWIRGIFYISNSYILPINPLIGYLWLWIVGASWGGIGIIMLCWTITRNVPKKEWKQRLFIPFFFILLGLLLILLFPTGFFPNFAIYDQLYCTKCSITLITNLTNFLVLMWFFGAIFVSLFQKDYFTLKCGLIVCIIFGLGLALSASFTLAPNWQVNGVIDYAPEWRVSDDIDWWKIWEIFSGIIGGMSIAIILIIIEKNLEQNYEKKSKLEEKEDGPKIIKKEKLELLVEEIHKQTKFFPQPRFRKGLWLLLEINVLLIILLYGGSYMLGVNLELYESVKIGQFEFPIQRVFTFTFGMVLILTWFAFSYRKLLDSTEIDPSMIFQVPIKPKIILYVLNIILIIGVITIYPSSLILYYILLYWLGFLALIAMDLQEFHL